MYLLLSGEGKSDIGECDLAMPCCDADRFKLGPMSIVIDQLVQTSQGYEFSYLDNGCFSFVSEAFLANNRAKPAKKAMNFPGKKKPVETQYYYENARTLAIAAKAKADELKDTVLAVLFRDADGTASAGRGNWRDKRNSMLSGFADAGFELGVAMLPNPKSEAWLLCALKENPYQHCQQLENASGNDNSEQSLKEQLAKALQGNACTEQLNALLIARQINVDQINMNSFNVFRQDLQCAVRTALGFSD